MDYPELSYYEPSMEGEWKTRKITIMGVVRSFVSQLRPGQDLTRVSLPAVLLHPFSILEVFGLRELNVVETLLPANREKDPLERFLQVCRWYLAMIQKEDFHKKPYNPVIGENHECSVQSSQFGKTDFCAEQVSHHPPISAFYVYNAQEKVAVNVNISFGVKFGGNYVSIVTEGAATINLENWGEEYEIPKKTPDMVVKNVVFGTKKIYWSGDVSLSCAKTGYSANFSFKESGSDNTVKGNILYTDPNTYQEQEIFEVDGKLGGKIYLKNSDGKKLLIDCENTAKPKVHYKPRSEMDPLASMNVWKEVNKYIVENDMEKADEIKKKIEAQQRERRTSSEFNSKFFIQTESAWIPKRFEEEKLRKKSSSNDLRSTNPVQQTHQVQQVQHQNHVQQNYNQYQAQNFTNNQAPAHASSSPPPHTLMPSMVKQGSRPSSFVLNASDSDNSDDEVHTMQTSSSQGSIQQQIAQYLERGREGSMPPPVSSPTNQASSQPLNTSQPLAITQPQPIQTLSGSAPDESSSKRLNKRDSMTGSPKEGSKRSLRDKFLPNRTESKVSKVEQDNNGSVKVKRLSSAADVSKSPSANASTLGIFPDHQERFPSEQNIMTGWMKMRNSMKLWINRWFVLRPGKLIYYKDDKDMLRDRCAGILRLADCEVKDRPTNKDGFSFKIFHLLHYPIYHKYGLKGETLKMALLPVSWNYCILRVGSEQERKSWIEAINQQIEYANTTEDRAKPHDVVPNPLSPGDSSDDEIPKAVMNYPRPRVVDPSLDVPVMVGQDMPPVMIGQDMGLVGQDMPVIGQDMSVMVGQDPYYQPGMVEGQMVNQLLMQQKISGKSLQKKTLASMEEWKKEIDTKMVNMERRIMVAVKQQQEVKTSATSTSAMKLSFIHVFIVVLLSILIGRYLPLPF